MLKVWAISSLGVALTAPGVVADLAWGEPTRQPAAGESAWRTPESLAEILVAGEGEPAALGAAASELLRGWDREPHRAQIEGVLSSAGLSRSGRQALTRAIAGTAEAPAWLAGPLIGLAGRVEPEGVAGVLGALSSVRTRESARALAGYLGPEFAPAVREAALSALVRMTGRSDLGDAPGLWQAWLESTAGLSESQWRLGLVEGLARRADRAEASRREATEALVESLRRLHLATPQEERSALLGELLRSQTPEVRLLGFELVLRELSNNARLNGPVVDASLELLRSPSAELRARAAGLLARLAPAQDQSRVIDALVLETDADAAASLLEAASRSPSRRMIEPMLRWLEGPSAAAAGSAAEAAWSLYRMGMLPAGQDMGRVLAGCRRLAERDPTAGLCALLASAGDDRDRAAVARSLSSTDPALRLASADALAPFPEFIPAIAAAARTDPNLIETLARAMVLRGAGEADFRLVEELPAPGDTRRRALAALTRSMPATDLLRAARAAQDPAHRELALGAMTSETRIMSERASPEQARALAEGLTELARLRMSSGQPADALTALGALREIDTLGDAEALRRLRTGAMIALDRLDLAEQQGAGADVWLDALEASSRAAHARRIAERIRLLFEGKLDEAQSGRLEALTEEIEKRGAALVDPEDPDAAPPE